MWESPPPLSCGEICDPLAQGCPDGQGCYYVEETSQFRCMDAGPIDGEFACSMPNECARGRTCLATPFGESLCIALCDPEAADSASLCGGRCEPLSDWSYPVTGVGACVFLGG